MFKNTHEYICDICGKSEKYPYSFPTDRLEMPKPKMPIGWYETPNGYVCDQHTVEIDLDHQKIIDDYLASSNSE
jgi:hypothetical protein